MKAAACYLKQKKAAAVEMVREESSLMNTEKLLHFKCVRRGKTKSAVPLLIVEPLPGLVVFVSDRRVGGIYL